MLYGVTLKGVTSLRSAASQEKILSLDMDSGAPARECTVEPQSSSLLQGVSSVLRRGRHQSSVSGKTDNPSGSDIVVLPRGALPTLGSADLTRCALLAHVERGRWAADARTCDEG